MGKKKKKKCGDVWLAGWPKEKFFFFFFFDLLFVCDFILGDREGGGLCWAVRIPQEEFNYFTTKNQLQRVVLCLLTKEFDRGT